MLEMENMEVDQNDFPVYPPKIYKTEVYIQIIEQQNQIRNRRKEITTKLLSDCSFYSFLT